MTDWLTKEQRSRNMSAIRSQGTAPEERLKHALRLRFPRRRIMQRPASLPGRPDFYLPGLRLAIFADGCFWHGCPQHGRTPGDNVGYWAPKLARNVARAREVSRLLRAAGITPIRVWEHELKPKTIHVTMRRLTRAASKSATAAITKAQP
jgi:DNA mismatch endonuclease (patch repair protein)